MTDLRSAMHHSTTRTAGSLRTTYIERWRMSRKWGHQVVMCLFRKRKSAKDFALGPFLHDKNDSERSFSMRLSLPQRFACAKRCVYIMFAVLAEKRRSLE